MEISAKMVSDLRATTGAGLMDCKKALVEAQGNEEAMLQLGLCYLSGQEGRPHSRPRFGCRIYPLQQ